jgi:hypothetical protein
LALTRHSEDFLWVGKGEKDSLPQAAQCNAGRLSPGLDDVGYATGVGSPKEKVQKSAQSTESREVLWIAGGTTATDSQVQLQVVFDRRFHEAADR